MSRFKRGSNSDAAVVIVALIAAGCFVVACITGLVFLGRDPSQVIYFVSAGMATAIPSLFNLIRTTENGKKTDMVGKYVNGHLTRLSEQAGIPADTIPMNPDGTIDTSKDKKQ